MLITDQMGNSFSLDARPKRIVSLVPSQSEFLWDLGLHSELAGITKFCIHPDEMFRSVERVGGTKELNLARIRDLKPDLVIGNKEENSREQIEELRKEFKVWMSDIYSFSDAFEMMQSLGRITGREEESRKIVDSISAGISSVKNIFGGQRVAYFIWGRPYMLAGGHTFIGQVLEHLGLCNVLGAEHRYPQVSAEELAELAPEFCFLSSEPYPFEEKHVAELRKMLPLAKPVLVDGEMFSWYGSRLKLLPEYASALAKEMH